MAYPIFYPKSPTDMGGGDGGKGDASLYDLPGEVVDLTDGSWTLVDPDSLVDSVTFANGYNTVTWNALAVGSVDYNWSGGTDHRAPRWYKALEIDGTRVSSADVLVCTTLLELDASVRDFGQQVVCGPSLQPDSTVASFIDGTGGCIQAGKTGNVSYGTWQSNQSSVNSTGAPLYGVCTVTRGNNGLGSGASYHVKSDGTVGNTQARASNINSATVSDTDLFVMVGVGTRTNTDTIVAGDEQRFAARFVAVTVGV